MYKKNFDFILGKVKILSCLFRFYQDLFTIDRRRRHFISNMKKRHIEKELMGFEDEKFVFFRPIWMVNIQGFEIFRDSQNWTIFSESSYIGNNKDTVQIKRRVNFEILTFFAYLVNFNYRLQRIWKFHRLIFVDEFFFDKFSSTSVPSSSRRILRRKTNPRKIVKFYNYY